MRKIKNIKYFLANFWQLIGVSVLVTGIGGGIIAFTVVPRVFAAVDPGCYVKASSGEFASTSCPAGVATPTTKCHLAPQGSETNASAFVDTDCATITITSSGSGSAAFPDFQTPDVATTHTCGKGSGYSVKVSFDFGCIGDNYSGKELNPIVDIAFAIFRFLSAGVGLMVVGSIVVAGIQYSASRGDPQATGAAIKRVSNSLIALLIYMFMFAFLNFLVPGGMFL